MVSAIRPLPSLPLSIPTLIPPIVSPPRHQSLGTFALFPRGARLNLPLDPPVVFLLPRSPFSPSFSSAGRVHMLYLYLPSVPPFAWPIPVSAGQGIATVR